MWSFLWRTICQLTFCFVDAICTGGRLVTGEDRDRRQFVASSISFLLLTNTVFAQRCPCVIMAELFIIGQLSCAEQFPSNSLFCKWSIHAGSNWKLIAGHKEGQTQVDVPSYDNRTWWCHPIDIHYATKGVQGWPKFHVQIYHYDNYGRSEIYGYGFCYVPTTPGTHTVDCYTWRPVGNLRDEFRRFFLGGGAQLKAPDFAYCGTDRYRLQTEALGVVHFDLNIIARNFRKYGVEL